jgi:exodeoxyribonuclease V alpha subunit
MLNPTPTLREWTLSITGVHPGMHGGWIAFGRDEKSARVALAADRGVTARTPVIGESWQVRGVEEANPIYGHQIRVSAGMPVKPQGSLLLRFIRKLKIGIGVTKAARLSDAFGDGLAAILDENDACVLGEVLNEEETGALLKAWHQHAGELAALHFLAANGFSPRLAGRLLRFYGQDTAQQLRDNPYRILAVASWPEVDGAARRLGVALDDERRLVAAVDAVLYDALDEDKDTLIPRTVALENVKTVLGPDADRLAENAITAALRQGAVVEHEAGLRSTGVAIVEDTVSRHLSALLAPRTQPSILADKLASEALVLNTEQRAAVRLVVSDQVGLALVSGGAGTGKTTVLRVACDIQKQQGIHPELLALSGRAAHRLRTATGRPASTIAAFINKRLSRPYGAADEPVIVIDEASMLDLPTAYRILHLMPNRGRLVLVGDPYQLAPIGYGLVFHVLAENRCVPQIELRTVHRQAERTGIPIIALTLRYGKVPERSELVSYRGLGSGFSFIETASEDIPRIVRQVYGELGGTPETQVIAATRAETSSLNRMLQRARLGREPLERFELGDPVLFGRNDYERELFNGSLGQVIGGGDGRRLLCEFDGVEQELEDLVDLQLAYAITVHKSQGSQFQRVIVPMVSNRMLDRTLIYTALTRAVEQAVFVGSWIAFSHAIIKEPRAIRRRHALKVQW